MKTKLLFVNVFFLLNLLFSTTFASNENRTVLSFSEISLRIPGKLHLIQGEKQHVEIEAKASTLKEIITEVKGRQLIIRFPGKNYFLKNFNAGKIDIFVTVPEVDRLSVSGSGDIVADNPVKTRIIDLAVSGSGDILLNNLKTERVKAAISGSGNIIINNGGVADELSVSISGSGNLKAKGFEARNVTARIAGSGNCVINTNGNIKARIAGTGNVFYKGNPAIDSSVAGSGSVKKL